MTAKKRIFTKQFGPDFSPCRKHGLEACAECAQAERLRAAYRRGFRAGLRRAAKECIATAEALDLITGREYEAQQARSLGVSFVEWARLATPKPPPKRKSR